MDLITRRRRSIAALLSSAVLVTAIGPAPAGASAPRVAVDTKAPYAPKGLKVASADATAVNLTWQPSVDDVGVVGYRVFRNGTEIISTVATGISLTAQPENRTLHYQVLAVDAAGNRSVKTAPVTATIDTKRPSAPQSLAATQSSAYNLGQPGRADGVHLGVVQGSNDPDVVQYAIFRNGVEIGRQGSYGLPIYANLHLPAQPTGVPLWYQVQAIDKAGNRSVKTAPVTLCLCDITPPTTPSNLVVTKQGTGVHITWDPSSDAAALAPVYYWVRINGVIQLADVPLDQRDLWQRTSLDFPDLPVGQPLTFDVMARDHVGNTSAWSSPVTITL